MHVIGRISKYGTKWWKPEPLPNQPHGEHMFLVPSTLDSVYVGAFFFKGKMLLPRNTAGIPLIHRLLLL